MACVANCVSQISSCSFFRTLSCFCSSFLSFWMYRSRALRSSSCCRYSSSWERPEMYMPTAKVPHQPAFVIRITFSIYMQELLARHVRSVRWQHGLFVGGARPSRSHREPQTNNATPASGKKTPTGRSSCRLRTAYPMLSLGVVATTAIVRYLLNPRQASLLARLFLRPGLVQNDHSLLLLEVPLPRQHLPLFFRTECGERVVYWRW